MFLRGFRFLIRLPVNAPWGGFGAMVDFLTARNRFLDQLAQYHEGLPKDLLDSALDLMICLNQIQCETSLERAKRTGLEFWGKRIGSQSAAGRCGLESPDDSY